MTTRVLIAASMAALAVACAKSDSGITTSIKSQLISDDLVRARNIDVDTEDRVVTLSGEVRSPDEEAQALHLARVTQGVADVVDNLDVVPEPSQAASFDSAFVDARTTTEVKAKLLADSDVAGLRVDVDTTDGVVTLTGTVGSTAARQKAIDLARQVPGVTQVTDQLKVAPAR